MKNLIVFLVVFYTISTLSSCDKSPDLKENCYQAKVLSNLSDCGTIVQITAGRPGLPNSIWVGTKGIKYQKSYATNYLPDDYTVGKTIYLKVNDVSQVPPSIRPANCSPLPQYFLDIDLVDGSCASIED